MRILLVEDEPGLIGQISAALANVGFTVDTAQDGEEGAHLGLTETYHAIVLDLGLPRIDGVSVLRGYRDAGVRTPVLILTARARWQDRVDGLNAGGDDYLSKPFHMEELVARLRALIRRSNGLAEAVLRAGPVELNTVTNAVTHDGRSISLTATEFKLLTVLMMHPEQVHNKVDLAEQIYGLFEDRDSNTIEVFIARLRRKLGAGLVQTVRGLGYRIGP